MRETFHWEAELCIQFSEELGTVMDEILHFTHKREAETYLLI